MRHTDSDTNSYLYSHPERNANGDPHGNSYSQSNGNLNSYCHTKCNPRTEASSNTQTAPKPAGAPDSAAIKLNEFGNKDDHL
jgi:hypothetical protein